METIKELSKDLRLSYIRKNYEEHLQIAKQTNQDHEDFLQELLLNERNQRSNNGIKRRIRLAKFPQKKYLEDFEVSHFKEDIKKKFKELETLDFIESKENVILMSNPGMGKTHYASALGMKACL